MTQPTLPTGAEASSHAALLFDDDRDFVEQALAHLRVGAAAGEKLIAACPEPRRRLLRSALDDSLEVTFLGDYAYGGPVATPQVYVDLTRQCVAGGATAVRMVGEPAPDTVRHPRTWPQWARYEAVVDHALAGLPFHGLCAYSLHDSPSALIDAVRLTHRTVCEASVTGPNPHYLDPATFLRRWADPELLDVESSTPMLEVRDIADAQAASAARTRLSDLLAQLDTALVPYAAHLPPADPSLIEANEYLVAVNEVLINALVHGGGPATLRVWVVHDQVVATVTDPGPGFDDPFAGYLPGAPQVDHSRPRLGLWLARQCCDELSCRRDDEGFSVRLRADLDVRAP